MSIHVSRKTGISYSEDDLSIASRHQTAANNLADRLEGYKYTIDEGWLDPDGEQCEQPERTHREALCIISDHTDHAFHPSDGKLRPELTKHKKFGHKDSAQQYAEQTLGIKGWDHYDNMSVTIRPPANIPCATIRRAGNGVKLSWDEDYTHRKPRMCGM